ncbi:membrane protein insertase YidC [Macrococcus bovicus]|uniref:Membrane protein insertase YidC n=1 Tax=Macrococcus bovicus TaxID=69968 RepID=A0A4R6C313_9STAP|nr:membrane protein insertase YidC [Macrococcus bovicus]TDM15752.1 membrane protein insertase YidC [Macrococcus bovicus]
MKKLLSFILVGLVFVLSGCAPQNDGLFHQLLVEPFIIFIKFFADFFDGSYGMGIILVTLCVRILMMPLMFYSFKKQRKAQFRMKKFKPEIDAINKKMKEAATPEEQNMYTRELMALHRKNGTSPINSGCLPILIQMPILTALYFAISHNDELGSQNFLWFNLGTPDMSMALIAAFLYYVQVKLSMKYLPEDTPAQMKMMTYISPLMILIPSLSLPAAMPLYWAAGAFVAMLQQYLSNRYFDYEEEIE